MSEPTAASDHIVPRKTYYGIFAALLVLTAVTVLVALFDLGPFNTPVALLIATGKAALVVLVFMHLKYSKPLMALVVVGGLAWLVLLIGLTMTDFLTRQWSPILRGF